MLDKIEYIFSIICMVAFVLAHLIANAPPKVTEKIPNVVMVVLNILSANYKHTDNATTDIKGNVKKGA